MAKRIHLRPWDLIILLIAITLNCILAFSVYARPQNKNPSSLKVLIQGAGREWVFPMDADETITVSGPLGNTIVRIQAREVWVESSPCNNQVCVAAGHIHRAGSWAACLPNNVFFMIEGIDEHKPDAVAW